MNINKEYVIDNCWLFYLIGKDLIQDANNPTKKWFKSAPYLH